MQLACRLIDRVAKDTETVLKEALCFSPHEELLARRLIEAGVRLVTVNAWAGVPNRGEGFVYSPSFTQGWDHHGAAVQKMRFLARQHQPLPELARAEDAGRPGR